MLTIVHCSLMLKSIYLIKIVDCTESISVLHMTLKRQVLK